MDALPALTPEQRDQILEEVRTNPLRGTVASMRAAGIKGSKGQLHALIDADLEEQLREARGWSVTKVEHTLFGVATNPDHPSFERAAGRILKAYHPAYRDISRHELTGRDGGPLELVAGRFDPDQLTIDELTELRNLLEKARRELPPGEG